MYALPVAFLHRTGKWCGWSWKSYRIGHYVSFPAPPQPTLCPLSTQFYSMIAHRPIGGSLNWRSASVIGFLSRSSLNNGCKARQGRQYRILGCNKWAPSFVHAGKIATASIMQESPHTESHTHTHTLSLGLSVACKCVSSSSFQTMTVNLCSAICCIARHLTGSQHFQPAAFCEFQNTLQSRTNIQYIAGTLCARVS